MAAVGKSPRFDNAEIDALLNLKYAVQLTFSVLSVLYPGLDLSKKFHEDHTFPKSLFTKKKLTEGDIAIEKVDGFMVTAKLIPNLQLLASTANIEKQNQLPAFSLETAFPSEEKHASYLAKIT